VTFLVKKLRAANETPGKTDSLASAGSRQRFDQSERTITTEAAGILPLRFSQLSISERRR
jgi:hypothetical protein